MSWKTIEKPDTGNPWAFLDFDCRYMPWKVVAIEKASDYGPLVLLGIL